MQATIKPATQKIIIRMVLEAANRVNVKRKTQKLETALESKLKRLFIQHGNAFLKRLAKHKSSFRESISNDTLDELFDNTSQHDNMAAAIQSAVANAVSVGADTLIDQLSVDVVFSLENPRAVEYLDNYGAELVKGLDETSKRLLQDVLANATEQGFSYTKTAKLIEKLFTDWSKNRAKLIATTEVGNAYQHGNLIVGKDLAASGVAIEKSWLTRGDDKVDPHCKANADQGWIDVNDEFSSGVERPLDHPRCRCVMLMRRMVKALQAALTKVEKKIRTQSIETAYVFDKNGKELINKDGGEDYVNFTKEEVLLFKDAILTHNHPMDKSFSIEDVQMLMRYDLAEIRAVGIKNTHVLSTTGGWITKLSQQTIEEIENGVLRDLGKRVTFGELTKIEAMALHHHELWSRIASKYGWTYTRTVQE